MRHELSDCVSDSHNDVGVGQLGEHVESRHDLQVVARLQIFLDSRDHEDDQIVGLVDEQGAREVSYSLHEKVLRLS